MKKIGITIIVAVMWALAPVQSMNFNMDFTAVPQVAKSGPVEVYYFHMSRRCMTCQTVEKVAEEALTENFKQALEKGEIVFKSVNIEDKANKALLKKLKVSGQALLVVNGTEKIDITDKGFLYAVNEPAKLKLEIKTHILRFIK